MKWKFSSKKEGSGNSRKETLQNYEQKYLEKFDKVKNEIQKMKKKQQDVEVKELKERIGWATSDAIEIDIVAVSDKKAHVVIRNVRRLRSDGSLIEEATAFYALKNTKSGWKMYAISDITFPA